VQEDTNMYTARTYGQKATAQAFCRLRSVASESRRRAMGTNGGGLGIWSERVHEREFEGIKSAPKSKR